MKRTLTALASMLLACGVCVGFTQADASQGIDRETTFEVSPNDITNTAAIERMDHEKAKLHAAQAIESWQRMLDAEAADAPESADEPAWDVVWYEYDYEPEYVDYGDYSGSETYYPTDGLTPTGGINYHEGRLETYYSSQILYHQDTADWTLDDEGFYRTDEGQYVVAASDMEQGTVFEGSKGECVVMDTGCPDGVTDYYVGW